MPPLTEGFDRAFIDSNVILRAILDDNPEQLPRARVIVARLADGARQPTCPTRDLLEVAFVLLRTHKVP